MNQKTDNPLLDDVLSESAPADFREALLDGTLRAVRRRRRIRRGFKAVAAMAALALLGVVVLRENSPAPLISNVRPAAQVSPAPYTIINTQPLPASAIVNTHSPGVMDIDTFAGGVAVVETAKGNFHIIGDEELLALLQTHPAALVRIGPQSEKLIFANPADQNGFPAN